MLDHLRHSRFYHGVVKLTLLALILQMLVPIFHSPFRNDLLNTIHQCSLLDHGATHHSSDKSQSEKSTPCPLCQTLHLLGCGYLPSSDVVATLAPRDSKENLFLVHVFLRGPILILKAQPRAPPSLV